MKYLLWALVIYVAWRWYTASSAAKSGRDTSAAATEAGNETTETMVRCAQCGIHLPQSEAVWGPGTAVYCSEDHRATHHPS